MPGWVAMQSSVILADEYRPSLAEFAVLQGERDAEGGAVVDLAVHPHLPEPNAVYGRGIPSGREDFRFTNVATGRLNTLPFASIKTRAVCLQLGKPFRWERQ